MIALVGIFCRVAILGRGRSGYSVGAPSHLWRPASYWLHPPGKTRHPRERLPSPSTVVLAPAPATPYAGGYHAAAADTTVVTTAPVTIEQAAALLGVSATTIRRRIAGADP